MIRSRWKVFDPFSFDMSLAFWNTVFICGLSFVGKISDFSGFRPDNLTPRFFGRICPAAQSGRTLITPSSKKLWPSALQWFHRGSLAFFQVCTSSLRTTPTNVNNLNSPNEWNLHRFFFLEVNRPKIFFLHVFFGKKMGSFWASCRKNRKANLYFIFLWCSNLHFFESSGLGGRCWVPKFNHGTHDVSPRCQWKNDGDW